MTHSLQRQHEIAMCNRPLKSLDISATFVRLGDDHNEPDVIYSHCGETLGIEVATAYYDDGQAEREWSLACGKIAAEKGGLVKIWSGKNPDDKFTLEYSTRLSISVLGRTAELIKYGSVSPSRRR